MNSFLEKVRRVVEKIPVVGEKQNYLLDVREDVLLRKSKGNADPEELYGYVNTIDEVDTELDYLDLVHYLESNPGWMLMASFYEKARQLNTLDEFIIHYGGLGSLNKEIEEFQPDGPEKERLIKTKIRSYQSNSNYAVGYLRSRRTSLFQEFIEYGKTLAEVGSNPNWGDIELVIRQRTKVLVRFKEKESRNLTDALIFNVVHGAVWKMHLDFLEAQLATFSAKGNVQAHRQECVNDKEQEVHAISQVPLKREKRKPCHLEQILNEDGRVKLDNLKQEYQNVRPKEVAYLLMALIDLGYLDLGKVTSNFLALFEGLEADFGSIGRRQSVSEHFNLYIQQKSGVDKALLQSHIKRIKLL
jgi:hypothetical protein